MLIPQFSIRWILGLTTVCAFFALLVHAALRGQIWAAAVATGIGFLVFLMGIQAVCFAVIWMIAQVFTRQGKPERKTPSPLPPASAASQGEPSG